MYLKSTKPDEEVGVKFPMGRLVISDGVLNGIPVEAYDQLMVCLRRHLRGDWGILDPEDSTMNDRHLEIGERLMSVYEIGDRKIYIITERDRSITTILLPEEY